MSIQIKYVVGDTYNRNDFLLDLSDIITGVVTDDTTLANLRCIDSTSSTVISTFGDPSEFTLENTDAIDADNARNVLSWTSVLSGIKNWLRLVCDIDNYLYLTVCADYNLTDHTMTNVAYYSSTYKVQENEENLVISSGATLYINVSGKSVTINNIIIGSLPVTKFNGYDNDINDGFWTDMDANIASTYSQGYNFSRCVVKKYDGTLYTGTYATLTFIPFCGKQLYNTSRYPAYDLGYNYLYYDFFGQKLIMDIYCAKGYATYGFFPITCVSEYTNIYLSAFSGPVVEDTVEVDDGNGNTLIYYCIYTGVFDNANYALYMRIA